MGTDIHGRIQKRYSADQKYEDIGEIEGDRNYRVFAMLAGVRNGFGFAGVSTHVPLEPISEPRGLPDDLGERTEYFGNTEVKTVFSEDDFGDHSFSWVTLTEIINWAGWDKTLEQRGYVELPEWKRMQETGTDPENWCGDVSGSGVRKVSAEYALANPDGDYNYVEVRWGTPFSDNCATFKAWVDYLKLKYSWLLERDPAAIRLVFGFDS